VADDLTLVRDRVGQVQGGEAVETVLVRTAGAIGAFSTRAVPQCGQISRPSASDAFFMRDS